MTGNANHRIIECCLRGTWFVFCFLILVAGAMIGSGAYLLNNRHKEYLTAFGTSVTNSSSCVKDEIFNGDTYSDNGYICVTNTQYVPYTNQHIVIRRKTPWEQLPDQDHVESTPVYYYKDSPTQGRFEKPTDVNGKYLGGGITLIVIGALIIICGCCHLCLALFCIDQNKGILAIF